MGVERQNRQQPVERVNRGNELQPQQHHADRERQDKQQVTEKTIQDQSQHSGIEKQLETQHVGNDHVIKQQVITKESQTPTHITRGNRIVRDLRNNPSAPTVKLDVGRIEDRGNKKVVQINLSNITTNKPIMKDHLKKGSTFFYF